MSTARSFVAAFMRQPITGTTDLVPLELDEGLTEPPMIWTRPVTVGSETHFDVYKRISMTGWEQGQPVHYRFQWSTRDRPDTPIG